jgi:L-iditol 2-dehydrogenase
MKSVYFLGNREIDVRDVADPKPQKNEVLIAMKASGLCGSDLHVYRAPKDSADRAPIVGGHEPCGVIAEVGSDVTRWKPGDRVMMFHYTGCGTCRMCRMGYTQMCQNHPAIYGANRDGCHQDLFIAPADTCVALPDKLSFEDGAACSCGAGTALFALKRLGIVAQDTLAIIGQGPVGLSASLFASHIGARVIAVDISPERLELARELGAEEVIDARRENPVERIKGLTGGEGADKTMDASGVSEASHTALDSVRQWGHVCLVGMSGKSTEFNVNLQIIQKQLTIHGSWTFNLSGLVEVARYVAERNVPLERLITHRFPLEKAEEAYALFDAGKTGKVMLVWP